MKIIRHGAPGAEKPGLVDSDGRYRDLSGQVEDFAGAVLDPDRLARLANLQTANLPLIGKNVRLGPPVGGVAQLLCIGLNYSDHAAEIGMALPNEPVIFMKSPHALSGPNDPILMPPGSEKTDWEVELAIVIGRHADNVNRADALKHVAGFSVFNDVSERAWQLEGTGQWTKGKSYKSFAPLGPWLVTPDEIADPQNLKIWLAVDGTRMQDGSTKTMIFDVGYIVSFVSKHMTLMPGDVIATGTPPGVGGGKKPPRFLKVGETVTLGIEGQGEQKHLVERAKN
ncbi:MAG: fumarylacetoacetate hydrolase family protein [Proteobacteria bacterium]|nr:fumarylacetoacetate hydrolase family protein [Pseudomonadota bacterium]